MLARTVTPVQVRFQDVDMAGHVHHGVYASYFETARIPFLGQFIPANHDWSREGLVLARLETDYRGAVHLRDHVEVETWCSRLGERSFDLDYALFVTRDGERRLCTEGRTVMVGYDLVERRARDLPEAWRNALTTLINAS